MKKLKILILVKRFADLYPKHRLKFDMLTAIEEFAEVSYWHSDGDIRQIIKEIKFNPDFIFHYDIAWGYSYSPRITGLGDISIPKGCLVGDVHFSPLERIRYIACNKIDLIFSYTKHPFLSTFPHYRSKFRWFPFSVNPDIYKDWGLTKTIDFLLMGQFYYADGNNPPKRLSPKGRYSFREAVYNTLRGRQGFVFYPHPGHKAAPRDNLVVEETYAQQLNRSKMFFTCGGEFKYPVAKFFEAPACKTLLLAKPNRDILELGFQDRVNFVACNEANFYEKAVFYLENDNIRNRITENGFEFIHKRHTNSIRARQFVKYIQSYLA
ncbi:MAG: hypothetical protein HPY66_3291 [Firmicutes bacterium]|nr:hypothetical protein [Bacillota bacterium]MDI6705296.1 glycosyltransferase [Bacillota bacterium]